MTFDELKKTYEDARERGYLRSVSVPRLETSEPCLNWDPFLFKNNQSMIRQGMLDKEKLERLKGNLVSVFNKVPESTQWTTKTQDAGLTTPDLQRIIGVIFGYARKGSLSLPGDPDEPVTFKIGLAMLDRAVTLGVDKTDALRAAAIARMVGLCLMRVYEYVEGDSRTASTKVIEYLSLMIYADLRRSPST